MSQSRNTPDPSSLQKIRNLIQKILPLVDDVADALGMFLLVGLTIIGWFFFYLHSIQHLSLTIAIGSSTFLLLPWLILLRIWFALESLKKVPDNLGELIEDVSDSTSESFRSLKSGKKGVFNIIGQTRKLFQIRTLLSSGSDILEQYFSIGPLVNPFYLIIAAVSLMSLFLLIIAGVVLALVTLI